MNEKDMDTIADSIARVHVQGGAPEIVEKNVVAFRLPKQTLFCNFHFGYPDLAQA
jgi:hypothetical protein